MGKLTLVLCIALSASLIFNVLRTDNPKFVILVFFSLPAAVIATVALTLSHGIHAFWAKIDWVIGCVLPVIGFIIDSETQFYGIIGKAKDTFVYLATEVKNAIQLAAVFVANMFRASARGWKSSYEPPPQDVWLNRTFFIVSLRSGSPYDAIKEIVGESRRHRPVIDWNDNNIRAIPSTMELPTFVRHFAVCLMPKDVHQDDTKPLIEKFQDCTYWELLGPNLVPNEGDCVGWSHEKICKIDSISEIGMTTISNDTISRGYYEPLHAAWSDYDAIAWNSFDFTVRLACLVLSDSKATTQLKAVRERLEYIRRFEVTQAEEGSTTRTFLRAWGVGMSAGILGLTGAAVAGPIFLASWAVGAGAGVRNAWLALQPEPGFMRKWRRLSKLMETKFPCLERLVESEEYEA